MIKEEAIEHLSKIISQKKKSIGIKKRDFLERKGWTINETIRQYEEVLEFEEEQESSRQYFELFSKFFGQAAWSFTADEYGLNSRAKLLNSN